MLKSKFIGVNKEKIPFEKALHTELKTACWNQRTGKENKKKFSQIIRNNVAYHIKCQSIDALLMLQVF
jgi:hypothetical protein